jgi:hypothetical protein
VAPASFGGLLIASGSHLSDESESIFHEEITQCYDGDVAMCQ